MFFPITMINTINSKLARIPKAIKIIVLELNPEDLSTSKETLAASSNAAIFSAIRESLDAFSFSRFCNSNSIICCACV